MTLIGEVTRAQDITAASVRARKSLAKKYEKRSLYSRVYKLPEFVLTRWNPADPENLPVSVTVQDLHNFEWALTVRFTLQQVHRLRAGAEALFEFLAPSIQSQLHEFCQKEPSK